jgi:hypothetical protein
LWAHPLTQANLASLVDIARYRVVGPGRGMRARLLVDVEARGALAVTIEVGVESRR